MYKKMAPNMGTSNSINLTLQTDSFNKILTPVKAIRAKCLDCCNDSPSEVRLCPSIKCPLYQYRLGHRPKGAVDTTQDEPFENLTETTPETAERPVDEIIMIL